MHATNYNNYKPINTSDGSQLDSSESNTNISKFHLFRESYKTLFSKDFKESDNWLDWFIGFTEGNGSLYSSLKANRCTFTLTKKEISILEHIQSTFEFGSVKLFTSKDKSLKDGDILGYGRYTCYDKKQIYLIYLILNGNLCLKHRVQQLEGWNYILLNTPIVRYLPLNISNFNQMATFIPKLTTPSIDNAWLSGFIDTEGIFENKRVGSHIITSFIINKANEQVLLNNIGSILFKSHDVHLKVADRPSRKHVNDIYSLIAHNLNHTDNLIILIDYLNQFPLKTSRLKEFISWSTIS